MKNSLLTAVLVVVILFLTIIIISGIIYYNITKEPVVDNNSILVFNIYGDIVDSKSDNFSKSNSIKDIFIAMKRAKRDKRIKSVLLNIYPLKTGYAKIHEIGDIIDDFKLSGKEINSVIYVGGLREAYLGSFCNKVYLIKDGDLFINGIAAETIFLKDLFSKLGIKAEFIRIGKYKTAANMYIKNHLTPEHKESLETLIKDVYNTIIKTISENRKINQKKVREIIDNIPIDQNKYVNLGLIDGIINYQDIEKNIIKDYSKISFSDYTKTSSPSLFKGKSKIAVLFASGEIHLGSSNTNGLTGNTVLGSDTIIHYLNKIKNNKSIKALVLRVDSPGGSSVASDLIKNKLDEVSKRIPVVISMSDLAASGGYWISMSSNRIIAHRETITGSIGVLGGKFVLKGLYDKIGFKKAIIKTSKLSDAFSDYRDFTEEEKTFFFNIIKKIYDKFLKIVAKSRKMKVEDVDKIAQGRVWSGVRAKSLNLVDEFGGLIDSIRIAKKLAGIKESSRVGLKFYPIEKTIMDKINEYIGANSKFSINTIIEKFKLYKDFLPALILPYKLNIL